MLFVTFIYFFGGGNEQIWGQQLSTPRAPAVGKCLELSSVCRHNQSVSNK